MCLKRLLRNTRRSMLPGDVVRLQSFQEISSTLDEDGCCEGLPFMPEMLELCGRSFTVVQRVNKVCVHGQQPRKMVGALVLDAPRCDGSSHGGCEMSCPYLWKEQWLTRAGSTDQPDQFVSFIPEWSAPFFCTNSRETFWLGFMLHLL